MILLKEYIYKLIDPITDEVRYIGRTTDPEERLRSHIYQTNGNTDKDNWIIGLREVGKYPTMEIIETVTHDGGARERHWIKSYLAKDTPLFNKTHNKPHLKIIGYVPNKHKPKAETLAECIQAVIDLPGHISALDRWVLTRLIYLCNGEEVPQKFTLEPLAKKANVSVKGLSVCLERLHNYGLISNQRKRTTITVHIKRLLGDIEDGK